MTILDKILILILLFGPLIGLALYWLFAAIFYKED